MVAYGDETATPSLFKERVTESGKHFSGNITKDVKRARTLDIDAMKSRNR